MGRPKKNQTVIINDEFRDRIRLYLKAKDIDWMIFSEYCNVGTKIMADILYNSRDTFSIFSIDRICCEMGLHYLNVGDEIIFKFK